MKKIYSILMILAAAAGFTNCSKAELVENKETEKGGSVVYATTDAATKTTLADDYKVLWSADDQIKFVKDGATTTTYTFTLSSGEGTTNGTFTYSQTPEDGTYTVYYPATYDGTSWPAQTYVGAADISGAPMKATATVSGGSVSDISFKNEGGILRYTVKGSKTIKSINVKSGSTLDVTLSCGTSGVALTVEGTVFNIALPAGEYSNATLAFTATDNTVATKTASSFKVTKNKVSLATFEATALSFLPDGALPGLFTVGKGADGKAGTADDVQVRFSKGNLQATYTGSAYTWDFATSQYSCVGNDAGNTSIDSQTKDAVVDLFGWSTASTNFGIFTSKVNNKYSGSFVDWGEAYCASKSILPDNTWRTLSTAEWQYLFNKDNTYGENNRSGKYKYSVTVCGKTNCLILVPDECLKGYSFDYTKTSYTVEEWATAEAAGLVCLPAAGDRNGSDVFNVGDRGYYWSSTTVIDSNTRAFHVSFTSSDVNHDDCGRSFGYSVRLITESN